MDTKNAKGFESIGGASTPLFVLKRGNTGTINITLSSRENETVHVTLRYGGEASINYRYWGSPKNIPDGITYSFEPSVNFTLAPYSSVTETLRISASKDTAIRNYNLTLNLILEKVNPILEKGVQEEDHGHSTSLTIIDSTSSSIPSSTNTTTNIAKITAPYITTTTTLTSTTTATAIRLTEGAAEPLVYTWAVAATIIAAALTVVLLLRSKRRRRREY